MRGSGKTEKRRKEIGMSKKEFYMEQGRQKGVKEERGKSTPCSLLWAIKSESGLYAHKAAGWCFLWPDMRTGLILDSLLIYSENTAKELSERFRETFKPVQVEIREAKAYNQFNGLF